MSESQNRGRLAQVIATRGGLAPPEAPFVIEHREALIYMLCQAAELEHGIMCQYLYAAFSLKQSESEGLTTEEAAAVQRWRKKISHVATQEMLHLSLVQNLLSAIGGAPHLSRPNFPHPASHYPAGVHLALIPFGDQALRHFMFLERPEGMDLKDAEGMTAFGRALPAMQEGDIVPHGQDFATVGHLYRSIEAGIAHLADKYGERWLFVGPPRAQATQQHFGWPELIAVTDAASAQQAIDEILEQGEGPRGQWRDAHFGEFVQILDEFEQLREANRAFDPVRPVVPVNVRPAERDVDVPLVTDPLARRVMDLFNVSYEILLTILQRFFAHTEETERPAQGARRRERQPDVRGGQAARRPGHHAAGRAGVPGPHGRAQLRAVLRVRLRAAAPRGGLDPARRAHPRGRRLLPARRPLRPGGDGRPRRGPVRPDRDRRCPGRPPAGGQARRAPGPGRGPRHPAGPRRRFGPNGPALSRLPATRRCPASAPWSARPTRPCEPTRPTPARWPAWSTASCAPWPARCLAREIPRTPKVPKIPKIPDILKVPKDLQTPQESQKPLAPQEPSPSLWDLAVTATGLRARLAAEAPPGLLEAVAALQDLAVRQAPAGERADRMADLEQLQRVLPPAIMTAKNGPYLVTNVPTVRTPLGERLPAAPQLALCRCGGSSSKPFCDGTHAGNGFSDAKDPNRVPDQRDTYPGQQVTIFDNRGICQHSGLCTDRLATVFRTDQEPFVAPSGGRLDEIVRAVRDCPSGALSLAFDGADDRDEARDLTDWHAGRERAIEVTQDGPYRVTGGIGLTDGTGADVPRAAGSSREHYALCRCGHSQNKPFCSGMHWYAGFRDPVRVGEPTLFEWAGGLPALTRMTRLLYEKHVPADDLLAPLFATMAPGLPAARGGHAGRGLRRPRAGRPRPGRPRAGRPRAGRPRAGRPAWPTPPGAARRRLGPERPGFTEAQRARWVALAARAADEAGLPADPEFRSAFTSYLEWSSRASQAGSPPRWDWGPARPPKPRRRLAPTTRRSSPGPDPMRQSASPRTSSPCSASTTARPWRAPSTCGRRPTSRRTRPPSSTG